jgi:hypothetical protein
VCVTRILSSSRVRLLEVRRKTASQYSTVRPDLRCGHLKPRCHKVGQLVRKALSREDFLPHQSDGTHHGSSTDPQLGQGGRSRGGIVVVPRGCVEIGIGSSRWKVHPGGQRSLLLFLLLAPTAAAGIRCPAPSLFLGRRRRGDRGGSGIGSNNQRG